MKGLIFVSEKTRVRLKIVGSEFVVSADEDKDYIVKISNMVDEQIKELLRQSDSMNVSMAAILAALNYCDELEKERIITEELLKRTETSESIASKVSSELEYLRIENKRLREEKLGLHKVIDELQSLGGEVLKTQPEQLEESPQQLRIPLPDNDGETLPKQEEKPVEEVKEVTQQVPQPVETQAASKEPEKPTEKTTESKPQQKQSETPQTQAQVPAQIPSAPLTARQMLEEKRKALLAQKNAAPNSGAKNQNKPKPFRPVTSAKSGGGAFKGNSKMDPKINYRDNDKISDSYRRSDFADIPPEEEMLSFFDRR